MRERDKNLKMIKLNKKLSIVNMYYQQKKIITTHMTIRITTTTTNETVTIKHSLLINCRENGRTLWNEKKNGIK